MPSPFFCLFFFPNPPQFSKDVLVNIYSAYIDNFLNAKDAVRIAKEARPAFIKFLEVGVGATGGAESGLMGLNWLSMAKLGIFPASFVVGSVVWDKPASLRRVSKGVPKTPKRCCCRSKAGVTACVPPNGPVLVPADFFFCLFLQQSMRENKEKQALSDLMIKPVQRIPRYELLVKVGGAAPGRGPCRPGSG